MLPAMTHPAVVPAPRAAVGTAQPPLTFTPRAGVVPAGGLLGGARGQGRRTSSWSSEWGDDRPGPRSEDSQEWPDRWPGGPAGEPERNTGRARGTTGPGITPQTGGGGRNTLFD